MRHALVEVGPPREEVFRVGWHRSPLDPPPWSKATADGTFGNRFDDPGTAEETSLEERFRCTYWGTIAEAAFGETLADFRVPITLLAHLDAEVNDPESAIEVLAGIVDVGDPSIPVRGIIPARWRERRKLVRTRLDASLRFANDAHRESRQYFRAALAREAARLNINDVDFATMLSRKQRTFTQVCARHLYELQDPSGSPRFHGIRYLSRLDAQEWECWALFHDRVEGRHTPNFPESIMPDHSARIRVARSFDLSIEVISGNGVLLRP